MHRANQFLFFAWIYFLQGSLFAIIPYSDHLIHELFKEHAHDYATLFVAIGIGGTVAALALAKYGHLFDNRHLLRWGFFFHLFAFYLVTMLLLVLPSTKLSIVLFWAALFFWGLGFGTLLPVCNLLIFQIFTKKTVLLFFLYYAFFGLGGFLVYFPSNTFWIFTLYGMISYFILFLLTEFVISKEEKNAGVALIGKSWSLYLSLLVLAFCLSLIDYAFFWHDLIFWQTIVITGGRTVVALLLLFLPLGTLFWSFPLFLLLFTSLLSFLPSMPTTVAILAIFFFSACLWPLQFFFGLDRIGKNITLSAICVACSVIGYSFGFYLFEHLASSSHFMMPLLLLLPLILFLLNLVTLRKTRA